MKKFGILCAALAALVALSAVGCASSPKAASASPLAVYAGEYEVYTIKDGKQDALWDLFAVDENGEITGAVEDSGYSGFIGQVKEDGSFECTYPKLGGWQKGVIAKDGTVKGEGEARGRQSVFEGKKR